MLQDFITDACEQHQSIFYSINFSPFNDQENNCFLQVIWCRYSGTSPKAYDSLKIRFPEILFMGSGTQSIKACCCMYFMPIQQFDHPVSINCNVFHGGRWTGSFRWQIKIASLVKANWNCK